ncbi:uncharacterized protein LOC107805476 [Nicotiana tabacum]|uniref:Uncharacterized protein LOC107805476 n=1 Tax=Nicotiana tabacum TaxID=4097 RepID=A0A1S4B838_TOBAC|nr:uncharacterized protein LOC104092481 [Nicotiana tomentosiformis]XP_016485017.1 PREDICTED: uncharacterized protein LOC107805476 [Nicotiana tabacum]
MAVRHFPLVPFLVWKSSSTKKERPSQRVLVRSSNHNPSIKLARDTSSHLQIRSSSNKKLKVFEDRSTGIVCYRDANGEITCEGYDEGPRYCQQLPRFSSNSRDEEIIELLQICWLHVADSAEFN